MKLEKKKTFVIILVLLIAGVFISGCIGQQPGTTIKSSEEASQRALNISEDIDKVADTLADIDNKIG